MSKILYNGKIFQKESIFIDVTSDWAKFSLGFFETIKVYNGKLLFYNWHYNRMQMAATYWNVKLPKPAVLLSHLEKLLKKNKLDSARLRIQFIVSLKNRTVDYLATLVPLSEGDAYSWLKKGWKIDIYKKDCQSLDSCRFKSNARDTYLLAKAWADRNKLDDALILNTNQEIIETSSCALFWVKNESLFTPVQHKGNVESVFYQFLKSKQKKWGFSIKERKCTAAKLYAADEIFAANVIRGIRWIKKLDKHTYNNTISYQLYQQLKAWEEKL